MDPKTALHTIHLSDIERKNLIKYKKFIEEFNGQQLRIPQSAAKIREEWVPEPIRRLSLKMILEHEADRLPSVDDINEFAKLLEASQDVTLQEIDGNPFKTISFDGLMSVLRASKKSITKFFSPVTFFNAHFSDWHCQAKEFRIKIEVVVEFLSLKFQFMRNSIKMAQYDPNSTGYLTKKQLRDYYSSEVMTQVDLLKDLEEQFQICYLNTVETMFFFFLDPKHTGRIRISDVLVSGFLESAFNLQRASDSSDNWFSPEKTHEQNSIFQRLDLEHKNFLSKADFKKHVEGATQTFVDQLYEVHVHNGGEAMAYEEFVTYQIASNHMMHPSSMAYFFKVLDVDGNGVLTRFELRYFYPELCLCYNELFESDEAMPKFEDFSDQFFDMVKPIEDGRISLQQLIDCKQGHDFIFCLINYQEFYRYDMRSENNNMLDQDSEVPLFDDFETDEQQENINELEKNIVDECNNNVDG